MANLSEHELSPFTRLRIGTLVKEKLYRTILINSYQLIQPIGMINKDEEIFWTTFSYFSR